METFPPPPLVPTHVLYVTRDEYRAIMRRTEELLAEPFGRFAEGAPVDILVAVIRSLLGVEVPTVIFGIEVVAAPPPQRFQPLE